MRLLKKTSKKNMLMVFGIVLVIQIIPLLSTFKMSLVSDNVAIFFSAAKIAGLDWGGLYEMNYYGQGYYFLFAPLFALSDNPYVIYTIILITNKFIISFFSIIIYFAVVSLLKLPDSIWTVLAVAYATTFIGGEKTGFSNETPVFLVTWVVCFLLIKSSQTKKDKTKQNKWTFFLVLMLFYGLTVHTRLAIFVFSIAFVAAIYFCVSKAWIVNPYIFYPGVVLGYGGAELIKKFLLKFLWGGRALGEVHNANIIVSSQFQRTTFSIKVLTDVIIGNAYKLIIETNGLALIVALITAIAIYRTIYNFLKIKKRSEEINILPTEQFATLLVFGSCIIASILALYLLYGEGIRQTYTGDIIHKNTSGLSYYRYYATYFGPLFLILVKIIHANKKKWTYLPIAAIPLFVGSAIYVKSQIVPHIGAYASNFNKENVALYGFFGGVVFICATLLLMYLLLYKDKARYLSVAAVFFAVSVGFSTFSWPFFNLVGEPYSSVSYEVLNYLDNSVGIPDEIFVDGAQARHQFMLPRKKILLRDPSCIGTSGEIYISRSNTAEGTEHLEKLGYTPYVLSSFECIWLMDKQQEISLYNYAVEKNRSLNIVPEILITAAADDSLTDFEKIYLNGVKDIWLYQLLLPYEIQLVSKASQYFKIDLQKSMLIYETKSLYSASYFAYSDEISIVTKNISLQKIMKQNSVPFIPVNEWDSPFDNMRLGRGSVVPGAGKITVSPGDVMFGPYDFIDEGSYILTIEGENLNSQNLYVSAWQNGFSVQSEIITENENEISMIFSVEEALFFFEIVLPNSTKKEMGITKINIKKITNT